MKDRRTLFTYANIVSMKLISTMGVHMNIITYYKSIVNWTWVEFFEIYEFGYQ